MSKFFIFFDLLSKMSRDEVDRLARPDLEGILGVAAGAVIDDIGDDSVKIGAKWVTDNRPSAPYIDFYFALSPDWLACTPDDRQVKTCVTFCTEDMRSWTVRMVVDCEDGEMEGWGERTFGSRELCGRPGAVGYMLGCIRDQYEARMRKERGKCDAALEGAKRVAGELLGPHVDAIREICKANRLGLYIDHSLVNGSGVLRVIPDGIEPGERREGDAEVPEDSIPFIDIGAMGFDSEYDVFRLVK